MRRISVDEKFLKRNDAAARQAFTLVELMIVVVILAILMGLLLPAVMSAFGSGRDAQTQMEIRSLEQGIAAFKTQFGIEPPSSITLAEIAADTPARDQAILRRIWPRLTFGAGGNTYDLDGDGTGGEANTRITLNGAECLVFFLGGVRARDGSTPLAAVTGFSKNPLNPFAEQVVGEVRDGPFFEFKTTRLVPSNVNSNFLVYIDTFPGQAAPYAPYYYASSYEGRGYLAADLINNPTPAPTPPNTQLSSAYFLTATNFINPKTFQIISPGADHLYGDGGAYNETAYSTNCNLSSRFDYDNLTNFHTGRLKP